MNMKKNVIITGPPRSGKSTSIQRVLLLLKQENVNVGGILTPEVKRNEQRVGFDLFDILTHEVYPLARREEKPTVHPSPRIGPYSVIMNSLNVHAVNALQDALSKADIIIVDEIGKMELLSSGFVEVLRNIINSPKPLIGTVGWGIRHKLVDILLTRLDTEIIQLTPLNRNGLPQEIYSHFQKTILKG